MSIAWRASRNYWPLEEEKHSHTVGETCYLFTNLTKMKETKERQKRRLKSILADSLSWNYGKNSLRFLSTSGFGDVAG